MSKLIAQGAEAKIYQNSKSIIKDRIKKSYRLPEIDVKLRKQRTRAEAKLLSAAQRAGIPVPSVLEVDDKKMLLKIERIDGVKFRDWLDHSSVKDAGAACKELGQKIRKLHEAGMVHGDLTTSNIIRRDSKLVIIDFGLGQFTDRLEDKAVDIHLFKECLRSKHSENWRSLWTEFKEGYSIQNVLEQLKKVESRGRYKNKA